MRYVEIDGPIPEGHVSRGVIVNTSLIALIIIIIAVLLMIFGGLMEGLQFLLWVGIVLAVIAVIVFLLRFIGGRR